MKTLPKFKEKVFIMCDFYVINKVNSMWNSIKV